MDFIYVLLLLTLVFYSLHLKNNDKHFKPYIYGVSTLFGLFMLAVFIVLAVDLFRGLIYGSACNYYLTQSLSTTPTLYQISQEGSIQSI